MIENIFGRAKGIFNIITYIDLGLGLLYAVIGLIFFTNPDLSNVLVSVFTGLLLIFNGAVSIYSYLRRGGIELYNNNLIFGIILILIGIVSMFSGKILSIMLGIYYLTSGIQKGNYGLLLKKFNEKSWLFIMVVGILYAILGIVAFFTSSDNVIVVTGICLIGYGIINIIDTLLLRHRSEYFIA